MILRKPYAFFIKHFKLLNAILSALEIYIVYKLVYLSRFFFEYSGYPQGAIGKNLVDTLLQTRTVIVSILAIFFTIIILIVLARKKKPIKLYLFVIAFNLMFLILNMIFNNYMSIMEAQIVPTRTAYALRDISVIEIIICMLVIFLTVMRATGFDIKKFEFGQDLQDLDITAEDNEEFEIQIDVDSSEFKRKINKFKRDTNYFIKEHKVSLVIVITALIAISSFMIYSRMGIYYKITKINDTVNIDGFTFNIGEGYITNKDYRGSQISNDNYLAIIPITIKSNTNKNTLNIAKIDLLIDEQYKKYHVITYRDKINDLGITYNSQTIGTEFQNYVLVFEIPKELKNKKMILEYYASVENVVKFEVKLNDLDSKGITTHEYTFGETVSFDNLLVQNGTMKINDFELASRFEVDYKLCLNENNCYNSYEYIVPNYRNNYDKALMKIKADVNVKNNMTDLDFYDLISRYGILTYETYGEVKTQKVGFARVLPQKVKSESTYYIEVLNDVLYADYVTLTFRMRDNVYIYHLYYID